jgi:F420-0:gamma-glutamyl ligase
MKQLQVKAIRTRIFLVGEDLAQFIIASVDPSYVHEKMVLVITSKIVSLAERRLVAKASIEKPALAIREADVYLGEAMYGFQLTIKHGILIPSSGIDESNSVDGDYILFPVDPYASAAALGAKLKAEWAIENLGILITDSHTTPLRRGVTGIALSHWGFRAIRDLVGTQDLFGREMRVTSMNLADGLAAAAVMMMGEGNESCPLAVASGPELEFTAETHSDEIRIPAEQDLYAPLLAKAQLER